MLSRKARRTTDNTEPTEPKDLGPLLRHRFDSLRCRGHQPGQRPFILSSGGGYSDEMKEGIPSVGVAKPRLAALRSALHFKERHQVVGVVAGGVADASLRGLRFTASGMSNDA